ncbi:MAG TPA: endonuclease domain-containing protein [Bacteroidales bacterium]|nr:endonuclease domain-containing protein [Bacteroidales bacterium]
MGLIIGKVVSLRCAAFYFPHMRSRVIERNMFYGAGKNIFEKAHLLRNRMTLCEKIMWDELRNRRTFKVRFRRQHPIDIFIVDFYCHEIRLAIEIDREVHLKEEVMEYDDGRTHEIEKYGIRILRFTNNDVLKHRADVIAEILNAINQLSSTTGNT